MSDIVVPPSVLLIAGAVMLPFLGAHLRLLALVGLPVLSLVSIWQLPDGVAMTGHFLGFELAPLKADALSRVFGTIFSIMACVGALYAYRQARTVELCAAFLYAGASLGVVFAGDLLTLFVFWELMALGSTLVLCSARTTQAYKASVRYLLVHLLGGMVLMVGIAAWSVTDGDLGLRVMTAALEGDNSKAVAAGFILAGVLLNAGAPPFSAWLPDAYPHASPSGMVFCRHLQPRLPSTY